MDFSFKMCLLQWRLVTKINQGVAQWWLVQRSAEPPERGCEIANIVREHQKLLM